RDPAAGERLGAGARVPGAVGGGPVQPAVDGRVAVRGQALDVVTAASELVEAGAEGRLAGRAERGPKLGVATALALDVDTRERDRRGAQGHVTVGVVLVPRIAAEEHRGRRRRPAAP